MNIFQSRYVLSSVNTFITVFVTTLGIQLSSGGIAWTGVFWFSVLIVCARAAVKAVMESFAGTTADA